LQDDTTCIVISGRYKGCHFSKPVILEIVKHVESGVSRTVIVKRYKISRTTISEWMRDYGSAAYHAANERRQVNKTSILRAVMDKRMTVKEAMIAFRVTSSTIHGWIKAHKVEKGELAPIMRKRKSAKENQNENASEREKALEKALELSQLQVKALNTMIDIAEDKFKIAIRKKAGANQSSN
jgi:transposase